MDLGVLRAGEQAQGRAEVSRTGLGLSLRILERLLHHLGPGGAGMSNCVTLKGGLQGKRMS